MTGRFGRASCLASLVLSLPIPARADRGELAFGVELGATLPVGGRGALTGQVGLSDIFAARLEAGGDLGEESTARVGAHFVAALDVIEWVPEAAAGVVGVLAAEDALAVRGALRAGVRRFIGSTTSLGAAVAGEIGSDWSVAFLLSVTWHPR